MALYDIATSSVVLQSFGPASTSYASPADAYAAWAAVLGVSATTSVAGAPLGNDGFSLLDLGFSPLSGGSTKLAWSSEGALALYKTAPTDATLYTTSVAAPPSQLGLSKFVGTTSKPTLILAAKVYSQDSSCSLARWQLSGTTAIFYFEVADWNTGLEKVCTAVKLQPGLIEVVSYIDPAYSSGVAAHFQALQVNQSGSYGSFTGTSSDPWYTGGTAAVLAAGTPSRFLAAAGYALGFSTTQFGAAVVPGARVAAGIAPSVVFGAASASGGFKATSAAPSTAFGAAQRKTYAATGWAAVSFGLAGTKPSAAGFQATRFGAPLLSYRVDGAPTYFTAADGWQAAMFGAAAASGAITRVAAGFAGTAWGAPTTRLGLTAAGLQLGQWGLARAGNVGQAGGFRQTAFGAPFLAGQHQATGRVTTRWGAVRAGTNAAAAASLTPRTALGQPRAAQGTFRPAAGFALASFGGPTAHGVYRAYSIPPSTRLGDAHR